MSWLLVLAMLAQLAAPALARSFFQPTSKSFNSSQASAALSAFGAGEFGVYTQSSVDCNNPQYPAITMPIQWSQVGRGSDSEFVYVCSGGAQVGVVMYAASLGYGASLGAYLTCYRDGLCGDFETIAPDEVILWSNGNCIHKQRLFMGQVDLPPGKYKAYIAAGNSGAFQCLDNAPWSEYLLDIQLPPSGGVPDPSRTLAKEDPCLANNPQDLGFVGDPVNIASGNFTHSVVDAALPTRGLPLRFERTYNSLDSANDGPLGYGWTHSYAMSLSFDGDVVTLLAPRGSRLSFMDQGNGVFDPGPGVRATLEPEGNGYRLTRADKLVYHFDSLGRLTALEDSNGNQTTLERDANGRLTRVLGPGSASPPRELTFTYDVQDHISTLSAGGQTITYFYTLSGSLVGATDQRGFATSYSYTTDRMTGMHLLDLLADPNDNSLTLSYDRQGRVLSQTAGLDNTFVYDYEAGATTVTDPRGLDTVYNYDGNVLSSIVNPLNQQISYTYDDEYNRTSVTDPLGRVTAMEWNPGACKVSVVTDTLGYARTFDYDARHNLTAQTDPLGQTTRYAYDAHDNLTTITDTLGGVSRLAYDAYGQLAQTTNALGYTTTFAYDGYGDLVGVQDALGYTASFEYVALTGLVSQAQDAVGNVTRFQYDAGGNLLTITDPLSGVLRFEYGPAGELLTTTDQLGRATTYAYDGLYQLTAVNDALGGQTLLDYDAAGNLITATEAGKTTVYNYDALNRLSSVVNALGGTTQYQYDAVSNLSQFTNTRGYSTTFTYDDLNRPILVADALGGQTHLAYDALGNLSSVIDPSSNATTFVYDALGRLTTVSDPLTNSTRLVYDALGNLSSITDANNNTTNYAYDGLGRLVSVVDALSGTMQYQYDGLGNLIQITDALGHSTAYTYDALNRLLTVTDPLAHTWSYTYDSVGNLASAQDANGATLSYTYDALDRLSSVEDALGGMTQYQYDGAGNLGQLTNARGYSTTYTYDDLGRLTAVTDPLGYQVSYVYNALGDLTRLNRADGDYIRYTYDALDRLTAVRYSTLDDHDVTFTYDALGNRQTMNDRRGTTTYAYDALGRLTQTQDPQGKTVAYAYDAVGNRARLTYPNGVQVDYAYDALNRLASVSSPDTAQISTTYTYDLAGRLVEQRDTASSAVVTYTHDAAHRLLSLEHSEGGAPVATFAYTYDALGNRIQQVVEDLTTTLAMSYTYDSLSRLTAAAFSSGEAFAYTYDAVGNRLSQVDATGTTTYTYDAADRLIWAGELEYSWTPDGNLSSVGPWYYVYDSENRLITFWNSDTQTGRSRLYDGDGLLYAHSGGGYLEDIEYTWDVAAPLPEVLFQDQVNGNADYWDVYGLERLSRFRSSAAPTLEARYRHDGLGSVYQVLDAAGQDSYRYAPFGELLSGGATDNDYRFAGELFDPFLGLYYLRARWYDPGSGRFLTRDPFPGLMMAPQTLNAYPYALNNPVNLTDPSGEFPWLAVLAYGGGYLAYNFIDDRVQSGIGRTLLDGAGFITGWENIQQDWRTITNPCISSNLCKVMAGVDMALNATLGVATFAGIANMFKTTSIAKQLARTGEYGRIKVFQSASASNPFRVLGTHDIVVPLKYVQNSKPWKAVGTLAHEVAHIQQEFGAFGRVLGALQTVSVKSTQGFGKLFFPIGYVLNPIEIHAAASGLSNWVNSAWVSVIKPSWSGEINRKTNDCDFWESLPDRLMFWR